MKFIFLVTMFTTMLFSAQQRQIVIGSFSVESNALNYTKVVQEQLRGDDVLNGLMQKYALKVEHKKVGDYNVVSLCAFENYPSLFETIAVVQKYYPQAYAIKFPAFGAKEQPKPTLLQEPPVVEEQPDALEEEALKEEELSKEIDAVQEAADEPIVVPEVTPVVQKPMPAPTPLPAIQESDNTQELLLLVLLLIVIIAYVVYKIKTKKRAPQEEE